MNGTTGRKEDGRHAEYPPLLHQTTRATLPRAALYVDLGSAGGQLAADEQATLTQYIASGRRVYFAGDNSVGWGEWNNSFLAVVGGVAGPDVLGLGLMSPIVNSEITAGVSSVTYQPTGSATGGTQWFDQNVMQLWGAEQNVLSVLEFGMLRDGRWTETSNAQLGQNVSAWLTEVPEPSTYAMMLMGMGALDSWHVGTQARRVPRPAVPGAQR